MKNLIAFVVQWLRRFCKRFSTYELCQPLAPSEVEGGGGSEIKRAGEVAVVLSRAPIPISESTNTINERRRRNGLGSGLDDYIARLRRDVNEERRRLYESKTQGQNYNRR